ncbi:MAG: PD-(D/E)XK motif protein [Dissulfurispiraceae bacterium]
MVQQNNARDFSAAWRALADCPDVKDGWRTIPIATHLSCRVLAGRHYPGNEEAIMVGFRSAKISSSEHLPEGQGFLVFKLDEEPDVNGGDWLALIRQPAGSLEIFTMMALDIISTLEASEDQGSDGLLGTFLARIRAWQNFMQRGKDGILGPEAEIGLHGELIVLSLLLRAGVVPRKAVDAWHGPKDGLHDFYIGTGAIEVKTTTSQDSFPTVISCLDQIDNHLVTPLYLAGVRLRVDESGKNLRELVEEIGLLLARDSLLAVSFDILLLHAGYSLAVSKRYTRRFIHSKTMILEVDEEFPKLSRRNVPTGILEARYQMDLDRISAESVSMKDVLRSLGEL